MAKTRGGGFMRLNILSRMFRKKARVVPLAEKEVQLASPSPSPSPSPKPSSKSSSGLRSSSKRSSSKTKNKYTVRNKPEKKTKIKQNHFVKNFAGIAPTL